MSELLIFALLFGAGIMAGICNAVAGGGTFFTFPVFISTGIPPVVANASNAVAVWPGHVLAIVAYRRELGAYTRRIPGSVAIALIGGISGALLLAYIGNAAFSKAIPFLILAATLLFAFGERVGRWLDRRDGGSDFHEPGLSTYVLEFGFAVYGGFFGAGLGIMLMAGLNMMAVHDMQDNNALKNLLAAVVVFALSGLVHWAYTVFAFTGAVIGGLLGARIARWLPAAWLGRIVITFGAVLTVYYFYKYYHRCPTNSFHAIGLD